MKRDAEDIVRDCKKQCENAVKKMDTKVKQLTTMAASNKKAFEDLKNEIDILEGLVEKERKFAGTVMF